MNMAIIVVIEGIDSFQRFVYTKKYLNTFYRKKNFSKIHTDLTRSFFTQNLTKSLY